MTCIIVFALLPYNVSANENDHEITSMEVADHLISSVLYTNHKHPGEIKWGQQMILVDTKEIEANSQILLSLNTLSVPIIRNHAIDQTDNDKVLAPSDGLLYVNEKTVIEEKYAQPDTTTAGNVTDSTLLVSIIAFALLGVMLSIMSYRDHIERKE